MIKETFTIDTAPPLDGLAFRRFVDDSDYAMMAKLTLACNVADGLDEVEIPEDIANRFVQRSRSDPQQDILLAEVNGEGVGYAYVLWRVEAGGDWIYTHGGCVLPEWRRKGVGAALLALAESRLRQIAATHERPPAAAAVFRAASADIRMSKAGMLLKAGYHPTRYFNEMLRPHLEQLPDDHLPAGLAWRAVGDDQDLHRKPDMGYAG